MRLSSARIGSLLENLRRRGLIQAPHCVAGTKGRSVNLWELKLTHSVQDGVPAEFGI